MKRLKFVCAWGKDKANSWSGTYWGLHEALKKRFAIDDIDIGVYGKNIESIFARILDQIQRRTHILKPDMGMRRAKIMNHYAMKKLRNTQDAVLQFGECPRNCNDKQYLYIDLHAGYVEKLLTEEPDVFQFSAYQHLEKSVIQRRSSEQKKFMTHAAGIFTMGKWLANELVQYGIPAEKVHSVGETVRKLRG